MKLYVVIVTSYSERDPNWSTQSIQGIYDNKETAMKMADYYNSMMFEEAEWQEEELNSRNF